MDKRTLIAVLLVIMQTQGHVFGQTGQTNVMSGTQQGLTNVVPQTQSGNTNVMPNVRPTMPGRNNAMPDISSTIPGRNGVMPDMRQTMQTMPRRNNMMSDMRQSMAGMSSALPGHRNDIPDMRPTMPGRNDVMPPMRPTLPGRNDVIPDISSTLPAEQHPLDMSRQNTMTEHQNVNRYPDMFPIENMEPMPRTAPWTSQPPSSPVSGIHESMHTIDLLNILTDFDHPKASKEPLVVKTTPRATPNNTSPMKTESPVAETQVEIFKPVPMPPEKIMQLINQMEESTGGTTNIVNSLTDAITETAAEVKKWEHKHGSQPSREPSTASVLPPEKFIKWLTGNQPVENYIEVKEESASRLDEKVLMNKLVVIIVTVCGTTFLCVVAILIACCCRRSSSEKAKQDNIVHFTSKADVFVSRCGEHPDVFMGIPANNDIWKDLQNLPDSTTVVMPEDAKAAKL